MAADPHGPPRAVDKAMLIIPFCALVISAVFEFQVAPHAMKMFADFGGALPAITRAAVTPWFAFVLGGSPMGVALASLWLEPPLRKAGLWLSVLLSVATALFWLFALYMPIFQIAGTIKD